MENNKITVPVDAEIRRYYRFYIGVEKGASISQIKAAARRTIQEASIDELRKNESLELPDVESSDILSMSLDLDGIMDDYCEEG